MSIRTKTFNYGNEHEAEWPPKYPQKPGGFVGYWDKESQSFKEGYPPRPEKHGEAPIVIFDSMPRTYHEGACREIESRKEWELADKQHGCITFGDKEQAKPRVDAANEAKRKKQELRQASLTALKAYRENPKEISQRLQKEAEAQREVAEKSGLDKLIKEIKI